MKISETFSKILSAYPRGGKVEANDPTRIAIERDGVEIFSRIDIVKEYSLKVDASAGKGAWAAVPWIAIMNPSITKSVSEGVYVVFLFSAQGNSVYLTLNQGTGGIMHARTGEVQKDMRDSFLAYYQSRGLSGFNKGEMEKGALESKGSRPRAYEKACILWKKYGINDIKTEAFDDIILSDLTFLINFYLKGWEAIRPGEEITSNLISYPIPKPFILLAGISGTGKSRFVRYQARASNPNDESNFCFIPVRPDWHEPLDLLGYISRISSDGPRFIVTDFCRFIVKAWLDCINNEGELINPEEMTPYWLCLDEMNLAPVEQYLADFLSVIETRSWNERDGYQCDPILNQAVLTQLDTKGIDEMRLNLGLDISSKSEAVWQRFIESGISLPPNLIVAGTVNMDETTHGFSRKVIDRGLTFDFGEFFPNDFDDFFKQSISPKPIGISIQFQATEKEMINVPADPDGKKTISFLKAINQVLKNTPFELAFRSLNEALLSVICFLPRSEEELQAVWDDFLMMKLLPRIEGDEENLFSSQETNLLEDLQEKLKTLLGLIWDSDRVDLFRQGNDGGTLRVDCRSRRKLEWMQKRLEKNRFTSFWP